MGYKLNTSICIGSLDFDTTTLLRTLECYSSVSALRLQYSISDNLCTSNRAHDTMFAEQLTQSVRSPDLCTTTWICIKKKQHCYSITRVHLIKHMTQCFLSMQLMQSVGSSDFGTTTWLCIKTTLLQ